MTDHPKIANYSFAEYFQLLFRENEENLWLDWNQNRGAIKWLWEQN